MAQTQTALRKARTTGLWKLRVRIVLGASWPTAITYILLALRSFTDIYFLGQIGVAHQAAWATGYVMILMFQSFGMGTLFAINSFVAKCNGRRWFATCGSITWQGIWFSAICGAGIFCLYYLAPFLISLFGHEPDLAALETSYLRIALTSTIFLLIGWSVIHFFLAIQRPFFPLIIAVCTLIAHIICNYTLTMGNFGFEQMGIAGSAWSLVFSSMTLALVALLFFIIPRSLRKYHTRLPRPRLAMFRKILKDGIPLGGRQMIDEFVWNVVLIWIIGQYGPVHLAAAAVLIAILDIFILAYDSIGLTNITLIAKALGLRKIKKADKWRLTCLLITTGYALVCGLLFYIFRVPIISIFSNSPDVVNLSISLAFIVPIFLLIYASYSTYDHAICATEDNAWASLVSLVSSITILGGGGIIMILFFFEASSYGAWSLLILNVFVLAVLYAIRWSLGYWKPVAIED